MATQTLMTAAQFDSLPECEGLNKELLDGELIEMASATYEHNLISANLCALLGTYLKSAKSGSIVNNTEFAFGPERRLQPDLSVLLNERAAKVNRIKVPVEIPPNLAIEIVSPSESARHLHRKTRTYLENGVDEVWVIYPESQELDAYRGNDMHAYSAAQTLTTALLPGWELRIADLFDLD